MLCASCSPHTFRANSIIATCIPRHRPRYGILCSLAYCAARIFPSTPRFPNPPGTRMPLTSPSSRSAVSGVRRSESTHLIVTVARLGIPPCFNASTTEIYASCSCVYFPTSAIRTSFSGLRRFSIISFHSSRSGSGHGRCRHSHATLARFSLSIASGASYRYSTSRFCSTCPFGTLQNNAILSLML